MSEWVKITQSCPTLCNPMSYTVHGILQARILEWIVFPFSRASSQPRDQTEGSSIVGEFFWPTGKPFTAYIVSARSKPILSSSFSKTEEWSDYEFCKPAVHLCLWILFKHLWRWVICAVYKMRLKASNHPKAEARLSPALTHINTKKQLVIFNGFIFSCLE